MSLCLDTMPLGVLQLQGPRDEWQAISAIISDVWPCHITTLNAN